MLTNPSSNPAESLRQTQRNRLEELEIRRREAELRNLEAEAERKELENERIRVNLRERNRYFDE
jgi:hypothetical protein